MCKAGGREIAQNKLVLITSVHTLLCLVLCPSYAHAQASILHKENTKHVNARLSSQLYHIQSPYEKPLIDDRCRGHFLSAHHLSAAGSSTLEVQPRTPLHSSLVH